VALDLEAEYDNSGRVPDWPAIAARWRAQSDVSRAGPGATLDIPYGPDPRERYDLFAAGPPDAPLMAYIHGGYWQEGERTLYAWLGRSLAAAGVDVAIPSYPLCPAVSVMDIVASLRRFAAELWTRTARCPLLVGHSAGGHLVAALLAREADLRAGVAISGLFELEPLLATRVNVALRLDPASARAASPLLWPAPAGARLLAAVGGAESREFRRQSREIARVWPGAEYLELPGANHFTIIDALATPGSLLRERVLALADG
jgi:arylformamidase